MRAQEMVTTLFNRRLTGVAIIGSLGLLTGCVTHSATTTIGARAAVSPSASQPASVTPSVDPNVCGAPSPVTSGAPGSQALASKLAPLLPSSAVVGSSDERPGPDGPFDSVGVTLPDGFLQVTEEKLATSFDFSRVGATPSTNASGNTESVHTSNIGTQVVVQNAAGDVVNVTYSVNAGAAATLTSDQVKHIAGSLS